MGSCGNALLQCAVRGATITVDVIAVVALLAWVEGTVAACVGAARDVGRPAGTAACGAQVLAAV
jgi:hypothetical protein